MKDWRNHYSERTISAEDAAKFVKSGDRVVFTMGREGLGIGLALSARKDELKGVKVYVPSPTYDLGWYDPGWEDSFEVTVSMITAISQQMVDERRCDIDYGFLIPMQAPFQRAQNPDVLITEISAPDDKGFCGFGSSLWNKRQDVRGAKLVVAEVNKNLVRTYGDNFIHVSEIDYFVEHTPGGRIPGSGSLAGRKVQDAQSYHKDITGYVSEFVKDGDTIQIGVGRTTEHLIPLGLLNGRQDIGYHSEATIPGVITLVREGVINGKRKTINPGLAVVAALGGGSKDEMDWASGNPIFHVVDIAYLEDIRVIAAHDNMVAINNAVAVDLMGQIAAEGMGTRMLGNAGGQIPFVTGALLSKGGRSITVLPSTALGGTTSRIMTMFPAGTPVTIQRQCVDCVVTEYGVARLRGKSMRQRAQELIAIAHPDFRSELEKEAKRLFWPQF